MNIGTKKRLYYLEIPSELLFFVYVCGYLYVIIFTCTWVPREARRGSLIFWSWSYRQQVVVSQLMWMLLVKLGSFRRAARDLNH